MALKRLLQRCHRGVWEEEKEEEEEEEAGRCVSEGVGGVNPHVNQCDSSFPRPYTVTCSLNTLSHTHTHTHTHIQPHTYNRKNCAAISTFIRILMALCCVLEDTTDWSYCRHWSWVAFVCTKEQTSWEHIHPLFWEKPNQSGVFQKKFGFSPTYKKYWWGEIRVCLWSFNKQTSVVVRLMPFDTYRYHVYFIKTVNSDPGTHTHTHTRVCVCVCTVCMKVHGNTFQKRKDQWCPLALSLWPPENTTGVCW